MGKKDKKGDKTITISAKRFAHLEKVDDLFEFMFHNEGSYLLVDTSCLKQVQRLFAEANKQAGKDLNWCLPMDTPKNDKTLDALIVAAIRVSEAETGADQQNALYVLHDSVAEYKKGR